MDDEAEVGFVETHSQGAGGDQGLDLVGEQSVLGLTPFLGVGLPGVGPHGHALFGQEPGGLQSGVDRECVDDAGALDARQVLGQPPHARGRIGQLCHRQAQALPFQGSPQDEGLLAFVARAQLFGHVVGDTFVGGRGGGQHGDAVGQVVQELADAPVVGAEVVAPVGDAVGLVDHDQSGPGGQLGQHTVAELGVVEAFGADEQHIDEPGGDVGVGGLPVGGVGAVDGPGPDTGAFGGRDLVAHERQQRGDDDGGPGPLAAAQGRGDEVHGGLAPPGALHDQRPPLVGDQGVDGSPLVLAQPGIFARQGTQMLFGALAQGAAGRGRGGVVDAVVRGGPHAFLGTRAGGPRSVVHRHDPRPRALRPGNPRIGTQYLKAPRGDRGNGTATLTFPGIALRSRQLNTSRRDLTSRGARGTRGDGAREAHLPGTHPRGVRRWFSPRPARGTRTTAHPDKNPAVTRLTPTRPGARVRSSPRNRTE